MDFVLFVLLYMRPIQKDIDTYNPNSIVAILYRSNSKFMYPNDLNRGMNLELVCCKKLQKSSQPDPGFGIGDLRRF